MIIVTVPTRTERGPVLLPARNGSSNATALDVEENAESSVDHAAFTMMMIIRNSAPKPKERATAAGTLSLATSPSIRA